MEISKIDKNFETKPVFKGGKIYKVPSENVSLFGLLYSGEIGFYRMPTEIADKVSPGVSYLNKHTAGGRVAFTTDSKNITVHVEYDNLEKMFHMPLTSQAGMSICEIKDGKEVHFCTFALTFENDKGYTLSIPKRKGNKTRNYIIYFPLYNMVKKFSIEIDKNASINPFNPYKDEKPILYYGSSITQGGCSSRSDTCYQALISKWDRRDFINLGFSGNCKAEKEMSKYLASLDCSIFVYDYDHNTPSVDYLKETHEPLFLEFRKTHPTTPIIIASAVNYNFDPKEYKPRLLVVKQTYLNAIARGDKNVYFVDGSKIYPKEVRYDCSVDGGHPTDLGFYFMAKKFYALIKKIH